MEEGLESRQGWGWRRGGGEEEIALVCLPPIFYFFSIFLLMWPNQTTMHARSFLFLKNRGGPHDTKQNMFG